MWSDWHFNFGSDRDSQQASLSVLPRFIYWFLTISNVEFLRFSLLPHAMWPVLFFSFFVLHTVSLYRNAGFVVRHGWHYVWVIPFTMPNCLNCGYYDFFLFVIVSRYVRWSGTNSRLIWALCRICIIHKRICIYSSFERCSYLGKKLKRKFNKCTLSTIKTVHFLNVTRRMHDKAFRFRIKTESVKIFLKSCVISYTLYKPMNNTAQ